MNDDRARRRFLEQLEAPFREHAPASTFAYEAPRRLPSIALVVAVPERPGAFTVSAVALRGSTKIFAGPFPGDGVPHWDVTASDGAGRDEHLFTCSLDRIVGAFRTWVTLRTASGLEAAPLLTDHLQRIAQTPPPDLASSISTAGLASANSLRAIERARLEHDLASLAPNRIARLFPRQDDGKMARGQRVLLAGYGAITRGRRLCLHVVSVKRQALEFALESLIEENQLHRWDDARWMWDSRAPIPPETERWETDDERCPQALALLDQGQYGKALALFGIRWQPSVATVLAGFPLNIHDASRAAQWANELRRWLWELAPWKLARALAVAGTKPQRLLTFSGQTHQRKASVVAAKTEQGVELRIEYTGTNAWLPFSRFARPFEQDLARFGLAVPTVPSETATEFVSRAATAIDSTKVSARMATKLRQLDGSGFSAAVKAGKNLDDAVTGAVLITAMNDADRRVRRQACEVAAAIPNHASAETAMGLLNDSDGLVRSSAASFLRRIDHRAALPVIARHMVGSHEWFLVGATALRNWGKRAGNEALAEHLDSVDPNIRAAACLAMVQYGGKALIPKITELAARDMPLVAAAAIHALEALQATEFSAALGDSEQQLRTRQIQQLRQRWAKYRRI